MITPGRNSTHLCITCGSLWAKVQDESPARFNYWSLVLQGLSRCDADHACKDLVPISPIATCKSGCELIGEVLAPDPLDERDGPFYTLGTSERLRSLPAGTKIYAVVP